MKTTYSLEILEETICRDDVETRAVHNALELALHRYQWQYQKASSKQFRDVNKSISNAIKITVEQLVSSGYDQLAEDVCEALEDDVHTLTKNKFITEAKNLIKSSLTKTIDKNRYSRDFAEPMKKAFIEQCEEYPLQESPGHVEAELEAQKQLDAYYDAHQDHPYK